jgi:hypothetical protein
MKCPNCHADIDPQPVVVTDPELAPRQHCVLCGRSGKEVGKIIIGAHGGICTDCAERCVQVLEEAGLRPRPQTNSN